MKIIRYDGRKRNSDDKIKLFFFSNDMRKRGFRFVWHKNIDIAFRVIRTLRTGNNRE